MWKRSASERDQVAEHMAGAREAVQQQQLRRVRRARLAVEDVAAVHLGGPIVDGGHGAFPLLSNNLVNPISEVIERRQ